MQSDPLQRLDPLAVLVDHVRRNGDCEVAKVRIFRRDLVVVKHSDGSSGGGKRGPISDMSPRALLRMVHAFKNCDCEFRSMLTLTYPSEFPSDGRIVNKHRELFLKQLVYLGMRGGHYLEFQTRGAPHVHILLDWELDEPLIERKSFRHGRRRSYLTNEVCEVDMRRRWFKVVGSDDPNHLKAGVAWEVIRQEDGALRYAASHAAKTTQKRLPEGFTNVGRWWGFFGGVSVPEPEEREMSTAELIAELGPSIISSNGRIKKYIWDYENER